MEEVITCKYCRSEYSLFYKNDEVVSQTQCKCKQTKKVIDEALNRLADKVSAVRKSNPKKQNKPALQK